MDLKSCKVVRVFVGPLVNAQETCFNSAWVNCKLCKEGAKKETMYHDDVKRLKWGFTEIVEWLKTSDVHFILCHMHQGKKHETWDCIELYIKLLELDYHLGYPMAEVLSCPIFTQNKINYLSALRESDRINFTLPVALRSFYDYSSDERHLVLNAGCKILTWRNCDQIIDELQRVCNEAGKCTWVLKFPFMTNGDNIKYCKDYETLKIRIFDAVDITFDNGLTVPYGLIQPCLTNGKEYKVILLDGKAEFHTVKNKGLSKAFSDKEKLYKFAETSLRILKEKRPGTIADGMVRVDIMERNDGQMIVNEFEGFEAGFGLNGTTDAKVLHCLTTFWANKLERLFEFTN